MGELGWRTCGIEGSDAGGWLQESGAEYHEPDDMQMCPVLKAVGDVWEVLCMQNFMIIRS